MDLVEITIQLNQIDAMHIACQLSFSKQQKVKKNHAEIHYISTNFKVGTLIVFNFKF